MKYDGYSELLKAAPKRLRDAWELLEQPTREAHLSDAAYRHLCGAYYLAGYAVECVLKVYIILLLDPRTDGGLRRWGDVVRYLQSVPGGPDVGGGGSHDLERLATLAELVPAIQSDAGMSEAWALCLKWDYNVRYSPEYMVDRSGTSEFLQACQTAYDWVRSRLPFD